jgi:hypothetical protein
MDFVRQTIRVVSLLDHYSRGLSYYALIGAGHMPYLRQPQRRAYQHYPRQNECRGPDNNKTTRSQGLRLLGIGRNDVLLHSGHLGTVDGLLYA